MNVKTCVSKCAVNIRKHIADRPFLAVCISALASSNSNSATSQRSPQASKQDDSGRHWQLPSVHGGPDGNCFGDVRIGAHALRAAFRVTMLIRTRLAIVDNIWSAMSHWSPATSSKVCRKTPKIASLKSPWHDKLAGPNVFCTWQNIRVSTNQTGLFKLTIAAELLQNCCKIGPPQALRAAVPPITSHSHRLKWLKVNMAFRHREEAAQAEMTSMISIWWLFPGTCGTSGGHVPRFMGIVYHVYHVYRPSFPKRMNITYSWNKLLEAAPLSLVLVSVCCFVHVPTLFCKKVACPKVVRNLKSGRLRKKPPADDT